MIEYGIFGEGSQISSNQKSEARKQCFLVSDWSKFGPLPQKCRALYYVCDRTTSVQRIKFLSLQRDTAALSTEKLNQANVNTTKEERLVLILGKYFFVNIEHLY